MDLTEHTRRTGRAIFLQEVIIFSREETKLPRMPEVGSVSHACILLHGRERLNLQVASMHGARRK